MYAIPDTAMPITDGVTRPGAMRARWQTLHEVTPTSRRPEHRPRHAKPRAVEGVYQPAHQPAPADAISALAAVRRRNYPVATERWDNRPDMPPVAPQLREHPGAAATIWAGGVCPGGWYRLPAPCNQGLSVEAWFICLAVVVLATLPAMFLVNAACHSNAPWMAIVLSFVALLFIPFHAAAVMLERFSEDEHVRRTKAILIAALVLLVAHFGIAMLGFGLELGQAVAALLGITALSLLTVFPAITVVGIAIIGLASGRFFARFDRGETCWLHAAIACLPAFAIMAIQIGAMLAKLLL